MRTKAMSGRKSGQYNIGNFMKRTIFACMAVIVALSMLACSKGNTDTDANGTSASPTPTHILTPESGGTLTLPMPENAPMDNPLVVTTKEMYSLFSLVFEGLIAVDNAGKLIPALAESWSADADDAALWTIRLRENVKWSSGEPFTAEDVKYTYDSLMSLLGLTPSEPNSSTFQEESGDGTGSSLNYSSVDMNIIGLAALPTQENEPEDTEMPETEEPSPVPTDGEPSTEPEPSETTGSQEPSAEPSGVDKTPTPAQTPDPIYSPVAPDASYYAYHASMIKSIKIVDEYTLSVTMKEAGFSSLYALTFPVMSKQAEGASLIGTGPYKINSMSSETVRLVINELWWRQKPYITNVVFESRVNNETALASFEAGQLNMVPTSMLSVGKYRKDGFSNVIDIGTQNMEAMIFNYSNSILSDIAVRKAIAYALNIPQLITNVYMNRAHINDVPIPPDSWLYDSKSKVFEYNLAEAKRLLYDANYRDRNDDGILESAMGQNLSFTLLVNSATDNTARKNAAEVIVEQLKECGIEVVLDVVHYSLVGDNSESEYVKRLNSRNFDIAMIGVNISRNADVRCLLDVGGSLNYGGINNSELSALLSDMLSAPDEASMRECASKFQIAFSDSLPFITLYFRMSSIVYSTDILGMTDIREPDIMRTIETWFVSYS